MTEESATPPPRPVSAPKPARTPDEAPPAPAAQAPEPVDAGSESEVEPGEGPLLHFEEGEALEAQGILLAVASGALTSGLGYVIWYAALRGHTRTSAALVQLAVPVIAALGGMVLLEEVATGRFLLAALLTLGGIALATTAGRKASEPDS